MIILNGGIKMIIKNYELVIFMDKNDNKEIEFDEKTDFLYGANGCEKQRCLIF